MSTINSPSSSQASSTDRKSTRLNSSHTEIYTLSLHDALPISAAIEGGVVLSLIKMNAIVELNVDDQLAVVEPGVINADLQKAAAAYELMFAPDPASFEISTIGG